MKSFSYVAQDAKGRQAKGIINAENEQEFLQKAKEKGLYVRDFKESDSDDTKSIYKYQMLAENYRIKKRTIKSHIYLIYYKLLIVVSEYR